MALLGWSRAGLSPQDVGGDVHSHLLAGVDDGVADIEQAFQCIDLLRSLGYRAAIITPHIYREVFDNTEATLAEAFAPFDKEVARRYDNFALHLGAEYMMDDQFLGKLYDAPQKLLRFGPDQRHVLVEFPTTVEPMNSGELLDECRRQNLSPIIAHIERYAFVGEPRGFDRVRTWRQNGALVQVNLGSFVGQYGRQMQRTARDLWRQSLVDVLGSDMHRPQRATRNLAKAWRYLRAHASEFDPATQRSLTDPPAP